MNKFKFVTISSLPLASLLLTAATGLTTMAGFASVAPIQSIMRPMDNGNITVSCGYNNTNGCSHTGGDCQIQTIFTNSDGTCQPTTSSSGNATCFCQL